MKKRISKIVGCKCWKIVICLFLISVFSVGCGDNNNGVTQPNIDPFTGIFINEDSDILGGYPVYSTSTFNLTQSGSSITGTRSASVNWSICCTATYAVSITGTVVGENEADLSWPRGYGECFCGGGRLQIELPAGSRRYTLVDNGQILRSATGADYTRQKAMMSFSNAGNEVQEGETFIPIEGDYIRQ